MTKRPPCTKKTWHINPTPKTTPLALRMCMSCPQKQECAKAGLTSGHSLDRHYQHPATGVIQAGIVCDGTQETARQLANVAQLPMPTIRDKKPKYRPPARCLECGKPMVTRPRDGTKLPAGTVGHMAQGLCIACHSRLKRREQREMREALPKNRVLWT